MNVVQVQLEVSGISDGVLPEAWLPETAVSLASPSGGHRRLGPSAGQTQLREAPFDASDANGEVFVVGGKAHEQVQVVGQQDHGFQHERVTAADVAKGLCRAARASGTPSKGRRPFVTTVKKNVPPGTWLRRYSISDTRYTAPAHTATSSGRENVGQVCPTYDCGQEVARTMSRGIEPGRAGW